MFISVHADSVLDRNVSGSSVYVLSLRGASTRPRAGCRARECADLMGGVSLDDKNDVLASVLLDVTQKEAVSNSVEAADAVLSSLRRVARARQPGPARGFRRAQVARHPVDAGRDRLHFECADERKLRDEGFQQRVAAAIHVGVRDFFYDKPPPGTKLAAIVAARRGGSSEPDPRRALKRTGLCYPRAPEREAGLSCPSGSSRATHPPDRCWRGGGAPGVRGEGTGGEQPRRRAAAVEIEVEGGGASLVACATTVPASRQLSWCWPWRGTPRARSAASTISKRSARWVSAAKRCRASPPCRA